MAAVSLTLALHSPAAFLHKHYGPPDNRAIYTLFQELPLTLNALEIMNAKETYVCLEACPVAVISEKEGEGSSDMYK